MRQSHNMNKPLTYNRFRAYLRIKLKNQHFSKKRLLLIPLALLLYSICSLTLFLLPHNVLTQYPYLKYFTDFMDFIPAIKQMEIKTFAPEMCKLYASYMFVVGVIVFLLLFRELFIFAIKRIMYPNANNNHKTKIAQAIAKPKRYLLLFVAFNTIMIWYMLDFFSGDTIGYLRMRDRDEYFIYNLFEMWYYAIKDIGFMFVVGVNLTILSSFVFFDVFKHTILGRRGR